MKMLDNQNIEYRAPSWLVSAIDQRVAMLTEIEASDLGKIAGASFIMTTLTEPPPNPTDREFYEWNHNCDNCKKIPHRMRSGAVKKTLKGVDFIICFGCCEECWVAV